MTNYPKKLAAWLHDPAEKQLVLMRDREGHEGGTSRRLRQALDLSSKDFDRRADWLAAASDRPSWPRGDEARRYPQFEAVKFTKEPELIHPLSGERLKLGRSILDIGVDQHQGCQPKPLREPDPRRRRGPAQDLSGLLALRP